MEKLISEIKYNLIEPETDEQDQIWNDAIKRCVEKIEENIDVFKRLKNK